MARTTLPRSDVYPSPSQAVYRLQAGGATDPSGVGRVAMLDRRRVIVIGAGIVLAILALTLGQAGAADLLIRNARLIDGTGAPPRTGVAILVRDSRIAAIAPDLAAPDSPLLDAGGATVLPGLIDAHVHLGVVPGSGQRHDPPEVERALRRWHLRAYLACGITTVLDTSVAAATALEIQGWLRSGELGPRYLTLGPGLTTPSGRTTRRWRSTWAPTPSCMAASTMRPHRRTSSAA